MSITVRGTEVRQLKECPKGSNMEYLQKSQGKRRSEKKKKQKNKQLYSSSPEALPTPHSSIFLILPLACCSGSRAESPGERGLGGQCEEG